VDDPKLRAHVGRSHAARAAAFYDGSSALAFSTGLHHRLVAVLGAEPADRGVDGSAADAASGTKYVMKQEV